MGEAVEGRRRAPEKSVLHEAFRRGWPEVSGSMPTRVKLELERFLTCGDARFGFVEVTCETCAASRVVAFCCKSRGWCPSCTTRRALDTGHHLESVLPRVAHRQWTLSLPFSVRFNVVKKPKLLKRLEVRLVKVVWKWQRSEARRHGATGALTGAGICFSQWFGSQLQLTPHLHLLVAEAMWQADGTMVPVAPPSDEEVARILAHAAEDGLGGGAVGDDGAHGATAAAGAGPHVDAEGALKRRRPVEAGAPGRLQFAEQAHTRG